MSATVSAHVRSAARTTSTSSSGGCIRGMRNLRHCGLGGGMLTSRCRIPRTLTRCWRPIMFRRTQAALPQGDDARYP